MQKPLYKKQTEGDTIDKQSKDTPQNLIDSTEFSIKSPDETLKAIHTILSRIRDDVDSIGIRAPNVERQMVLGQTLRGAMCLIEDIREDLKKTPPDTEKIHLRTNSLLFVLARFLAVSMGILDFDELYSDIALSVFHTNPRFKGPVDERAFSLLDVEEYIREKYEKE